MPPPMQMTVQHPVPVMHPGAPNVMSLTSPSVDQFGVQTNMAPGPMSPQAMSPMMFSGPQPATLSQLPTVGDTPAGGVVTRASPTTSQPGHTQQYPSVSSIGSAMASMPGHSQQPSLDGVISPFRSTQTSPRPARKDSGRETPATVTTDFSDDVSSITPASQLGRRRNPPAYTAEPRADERRAVAPTPPEDDRVKHEYGPSADLSERQPEPNADDELEYIDGTGTGTGTGTGVSGSGVATHGSPLESVPPRMFGENTH